MIVKKIGVENSDNKKDELEVFLIDNIEWHLKRIKLGKHSRESFTEIDLQKLIKDIDNIMKINGAIKDSSMTKVIIIHRTIDFLFTVRKEIFADYLKRKAHIQYNMDDGVKLNVLTNNIFGTSLESGYSKKWNNDDEFYTEQNHKANKFIRDIFLECMKEFYKQKVANNKLEINVKNDKWNLTRYDGVKLNRWSLDFYLIDNANIRMELKKYYYNVFQIESIGFKELYKLGFITPHINFLCKRKPDLNSMLSITRIDLVSLRHHLENVAISPRTGRGYTPNSVRKIFGMMKAIWNWIAKEDKSKRKNPFEYFKFVNGRKLEKNTDVIPDIVMDKIMEYKGELYDEYQLMLQILYETGLRAGEVIDINEDDFKFYDENDLNVWGLKYIPSKSLKSRRMRNLPDKNIVVISNELAILLKKQAESSKEMRIENNYSSIFIRRAKKNANIVLTLNRVFVIVVNKLIKRHNIVGYNGELWHFSSRQFRKTLAVTMIKNGATIQEVASQLGHGDIKTTEKYYAEVEKMKLGEMNAIFFEKEFDILMRPRQLENYTEEERRCLYVDFRMSKRRVELGHCTKHPSQGVCHHKSCATCTNICTGKKYIDEWYKLLEVQKIVVNELIEFYRKTNILDYKEYKEFKLEYELMQGYKATIDEIRNKDGDLIGERRS